MKEIVKYGIILTIEYIIILGLLSLFLAVPTVLWGFLLIPAIFIIFEVVCEYDNYTSYTEQPLILKILVACGIGGALSEIIFNKSLIIPSSVPMLLSFLAILFLWLKKGEE